MCLTICKLDSLQRIKEASDMTDNMAQEVTVCFMEKVLSTVFCVNQINDKMRKQYNWKVTVNFQSM